LCMRMSIFPQRQNKGVAGESEQRPYAPTLEEKLHPQDGVI
jgi:hypothetical protein